MSMQEEADQILDTTDQDKEFNELEKELDDIMDDVEEE